MPKRITKTVYTYAELKARKAPGLDRASQLLREWATDDEFWYECTYDEWKRGLEQIGFENPQLAFSGFWSQGDGASFTATIDLAKMVDFLASDIDAKNETDGEDFRECLAFRARHKANPAFRRLLLVANFIGGLVVERRGHHYAHWNTCTTLGSLNDRGEWSARTSHVRDDSVWQSTTPRVRALFDEFMAEIERIRENLAKALYRDLEADYEWATSDEAIAEMADSNGYTFTLDGRLES